MLETLLGGDYQLEKKFGLFFISIMAYLRLMGSVSRRRILHNRILEDKFAMDLRSAVYNIVFQGPTVQNMAKKGFSPGVSKISLFKNFSNQTQENVELYLSISIKCRESQH